ncbi:hypothetical protein SO802_021750 [Lithocarpus litseifolius]|uniref:Uncharacterized protein n=1 Tax=Lithocarpus litseifolius TaxID=425828 RepID=A0AAW2CIQ0_9ROSI
MKKSRSSISSDSESGKRCYRGHWKLAEDEKLQLLVEQHGPQNWNFIADHLEGRSGKSCRLRWYNQLDPNINKKPFTTEEEQRLLAAHRIYGNKWALIARYFKGRTDNTVKNQFHIMMARRKRERFSVQGHLSHSKFQNFQKFGTSSMSSLHSLSFSQSTMTTDSFSVDIFGGGKKKHLGPSISSCANEPSQGIPVVHEVVPQSFKFSNFAGVYESEKMLNLEGLDDNSTACWNLKMASEQDQGDGSITHKAVPFIDFFGVGIS